MERLELEVKKFLTERFKGIKGQIELHVIPINEGWKSSKRKLYRCNDIDKLANDICNLSESNEYHICLGVHSRYRRKSWNKKAREITALVIDIDRYAFSVHVGCMILEKIKTFPLKPSIVATTGNNIHYYWQLKEPILKDIAPDCEKYQKWLASYFGCDEPASYFAEVMKIPFTLNQKDVSQSRSLFKTSCRMNTNGSGELLRYELKDFDFCLEHLN